MNQPSRTTTAAHTPCSPHIAYVMKGFPRPSETFIANEIVRLQDLGIDLRLFSIKGADSSIEHGVFSRVRGAVQYLPAVTSMSNTPLPRWLADNGRKFLTAHMTLLRRAAPGYVKALAWALRRAVRYRAHSQTWLKKTFIKEFLFATHIAADLLCRPGPTHIHAHFCHDATNVAWMVSLITGLPFSFTAHAKDIYQQRLNPGDLLKEKLNAARFVVTCTEANRTYLLTLRDAPDKIHRVYHGLDVHAFAPCCTHDAALPAVAHIAADVERKPLLLSVGRLVPKKGFGYLVDACLQLRRQGINFDCWIVGERGAAGESLLSAIAAHDLGDCVRLVPPMTQEALRDVYARASVFALPSVVLDDGDRDGIPNVLAEAMAMAVPVVSTAISGIPELIQHGENGLLVPERDSVTLANAIADLLGDVHKRTRLAARGRQTVIERFDAAQTHQELKRLFDLAVPA